MFANFDGFSEWIPGAAGRRSGPRPGPRSVRRSGRWSSQWRRGSRLSIGCMFVIMSRTIIAGAAARYHVGADVLICPVERSSTRFCRSENSGACSAGQMRTSAPTWFGDSRWRFQVRNHEQNAEQQVDAAEQQVGRVHAVLHDQNHDSDAVAEFFEDGRNHQRPVAHRVGGDDEKYESARPVRLRRIRRRSRDG